MANLKCKFPIISRPRVEGLATHYLQTPDLNYSLPATAKISHGATETKITLIPLFSTKNTLKTVFFGHRPYFFLK